MSKYKFLFQETFLSGKTRAKTITINIKDNKKHWKSIIDTANLYKNFAPEDLDLSKLDVNKPSSDQKIWCKIMFSEENFTTIPMGLGKDYDCVIDEEGAPPEGDDADSYDQNGPEDEKIFYTKI